MTFNYPTHVYVMLNRRNGFYKIGISNNPAYREQTLQSEEPEVCLLDAMPGTRQDEERIHGMFAKFRVRGEWFNLPPAEALNLFKSIRYNRWLRKYEGTGRWPLSRPCGHC
jgi:hypothetical protein